MAGNQVSERIAGLDGLRGLAALMVIFVHSTFGLACGYRFPLVEPYFVAGQMGVMLFFVISAYCLYGTYSKLIVRQPRTAVFSFWIKRSCRIFPLWWIWVAVYAVWHQHTLKNSLASAFFYWGFERFGPFTDVFPGGWSLFVEETFYWLFPLVFPLFRSIPRIAVGFTVAWVVSYAWQTYGEILGVPTANGYIDYSPVNHWVCFFLGMFCFQLVQNSTWQKFVSDWGTKFGGVTAAVLAALATEWLVFTHRDSALVFSILLLLVVTKGTWFSRIFSTKWLSWFGRRCYSTYLCHFFVLDWGWPRIIAPLSEKIHLPPYVEVRQLIWFPIVAAVTAAFAEITYRFVEIPTIALGNKLSGALAREPTPAKLGEVA
jgi:peptidoglycan/LPS O-acetylase OafA/YrhL